MLAAVPAQADWMQPVPPFKGNDTGGIIAYSLAMQSDARQLAVDHCATYGKVVKFLSKQDYPGGYISFARYDKVVKFLAVQPQEGGYISFACRWVPYGSAQRPIRTLY
jgi:hypothetical protein